MVSAGMFAISDGTEAQVTRGLGCVEGDTDSYLGSLRCLSVGGFGEVNFLWRSGYDQSINHSIAKVKFTHIHQVDLMAINSSNLDTLIKSGQKLEEAIETLIPNIRGLHYYY